ncbi:hypothetical protein KIPB_001250, partial [Kipferlia bialata]
TIRAILHGAMGHNPNDRDDALMECPLTTSLMRLALPLPLDMSHPVASKIAFSGLISGAEGGVQYRIDNAASGTFTMGYTYKNPIEGVAAVIEGPLSVLATLEDTGAKRRSAASGGALSYNVVRKLSGVTAVYHERLTGQTIRRGFTEKAMEVAKRMTAAADADGVSDVWHHLGVLDTDTEHVQLMEAMASVESGVCAERETEEGVPTESRAQWYNYLDRAGFYVDYICCQMVKRGVNENTVLSCLGTPRVIEGEIMMGPVFYYGPKRVAAFMERLAKHVGSTDEDREARMVECLPRDGQFVTMEEYIDKFRDYALLHTRSFLKSVESAHKRGMGVLAHFH